MEEKVYEREQEHTGSLRMSPGWAFEFWAVMDLDSPILTWAGTDRLHGLC